MKHYETLGIPPEATPAEVKRAYKKLASKHHPDRDGGDPQAMAEVNAAYKVLGDPVFREQYDRTGDDPQAERVEADATKVVMDVFTSFLEARQPLSDTRRTVSQNLSRVQSELQSLDAMVVRLTRQREKVTADKGHTNLFQQVLDRKIEASEQQRLQIHHAEKVLTRAIEILEHYDEEHLAQQFSATSATFMPVTGTSMYYR